MGQQGNLTSMMLPLAMFAAIFYFMIMRPQKKKQQQHDNMIASISKGSEVVTAGGFFGTVREVLDDSFIIELAEGVKVRVLKTSISVKRNDTDKSGEPKKEKKKKKKLKNGTAADPSEDTQAVAAEVDAAEAEAKVEGTEAEAVETQAVEAGPEAAPVAENNNEEKA